MAAEFFQVHTAVPQQSSSTLAQTSSSALNQHCKHHSTQVLGNEPQMAFTLDGSSATHPSNVAETHQQTILGGGGVRDAVSTNHNTWSLDKEKIVRGPYDYMESQPGKDIRKQMIGAFNAWLHVPQASLEIITKVIGMLHTASLLY